uniref:sperm motility kinase Z-like n=1 Tax=Jaculus jaculus TaxID=51337 RepID=UPI001E1B0878|nr:sperm motility kinase Z-like [Jaculus jaculus]
MPQSDETLWSQYEDLGLIVKTDYVEVRRARHRLTGVQVAIKILNKRLARGLRIAGEADILPSITHPNIVKLFQLVETEENLYLVLEYCPVQLLEHVYSKGCLQEEEARGIFRQVVDALAYCHDQGIAHLDIKPDNVMLDESGKVTLIDFGTATRVCPGQRLTRHCGAILFSPPEVMRLDPYDGPKKDVWSLGVLLYFMVTGTCPFGFTLTAGPKTNIIKGNYERPAHLSADLRALIEKLLTLDPELRPAAKDILDDPWLERGQARAGGRDPDPREPDADVQAAMRLDAGGAARSVRRGGCDGPAATHRLLRLGARGGPGAEAASTAVSPGPTPFPSAAGPQVASCPARRRSCPPPPPPSPPEPRAPQVASCPARRRSCPPPPSPPQPRAPQVVSCPARRRSCPPSPPPPSPPGPARPGPPPPGEARAGGEAARPAAAQTSRRPERGPGLPATAAPEGRGCLPRCWEAVRGRVRRLLRTLCPRGLRRRGKRVFPARAAGGGEGQRGPAEL